MTFAVRPPTDPELREVLDRWQRQALSTDELLGWVAKRWPHAIEPVGPTSPPSRVAIEILAALDLLAVHLLTPADVPAMLQLLATAPEETEAAIDTFRAYLAAIDRRTRGRQLRHDSRYRPFCR